MDLDKSRHKGFALQIDNLGICGDESDDFFVRADGDDSVALDGHGLCLGHLFIYCQHRSIDKQEYLFLSSGESEPKLPPKTNEQDNSTSRKTAIFFTGYTSLFGYFRSLFEASFALTRRKQVDRQRIVEKQRESLVFKAYT